MSEIEANVFTVDIHGEVDVHPAVDFVAGVFGGCAGVLAGHPLDTIKVRLQDANLGAIYRNPLNTFIRIAKEEGPQGFYKGMASPIVGVAVINSLLFGVYGWALRHIEKSPRGTDPSLRSIYLAGSVSGFVNSFVACPMELVKIRLQNQVANSGYPLYRGPVDCIRQIYQRAGIGGFYRAMHCTMWRETPSYGAYFASYELLCRKLVPAGTPTNVPTPALLVAGGLAGVVAWLVTYPFDVVKTRLQSVQQDFNPQYRGMADCFVKTYGREGIRVFFSGMSATAIRAFPTNAATFYTVVWVRNHMLNSAPNKQKV
ncbi:mitochondrial carrier domain-containing protein [Cladochytrium replicatum]|nr:mitochondrial carrier domain-containing protein [Cladochytrium replicatum]